MSQKFESHKSAVVNATEEILRLVKEQATAMLTSAEIQLNQAITLIDEEMAKAQGILDKVEECQTAMMWDYEEEAIQDAKIAVSENLKYKLPA